MAMLEMTPRRIANACGGILHIDRNNPELADTPVTLITTDSRKAEPGALFGAIPGERADGHDFIPDVLEKGAICVISQRDLPEDTPGCWIRVPNTVRALACAAREYLSVLGIPVVGIAGSVGKTSTKEMVASVLSQKYRTLWTEGNFNNDLGLALTIFRLSEEDEMAVLEMGISQFGKMHNLAWIAQPRICVMTNIGTCHLENLGDRDGVLKAKSEIFDFLPDDGHIILNGNDDKLTQIKAVNGVEPVFYGLEDEEVPDGVRLAVFAREIRSLGLEGTECEICTPQGSFGVHVAVPGLHQVRNALAATAAGLACGLELEQIRAGLEQVRPVGGRFRVIRKDTLTIADDCYNANPMSVKAALQVLSEVEGRKVAVLGDMAELGSDEVMYHEEIGRFAAEHGVDLLVGIGRLSEHMTRAALEAQAETGRQMRIIHYPTVKEFLEAAPGLLAKGDTVLVKASHSMHFEQIVREL